MSQASQAKIARKLKNRQVAYEDTLKSTKTIPEGSYTKPGSMNPKKRR